MLVRIVVTLSSFLLQEIELTFIRHQTQQVTSYKSTHFVFMNLVLWLRKENVFYPSHGIMRSKNEKCAYIQRILNNNSILMQYQCHIRNQRQKLHRITYILTKTFFFKIFTCTPPQPYYSKLLPVVPQEPLHDRDDPNDRTRAQLISQISMKFCQYVGPSEL